MAPFCLPCPLCLKDIFGRQKFLKCNGSCGVRCHLNCYKLTKNNVENEVSCHSDYLCEYCNISFNQESQSVNDSPISSLNTNDSSDPINISNSIFSQVNKCNICSSPITDGFFIKCSGKCQSFFHPSCLKLGRLDTDIFCTIGEGFFKCTICNGLSSDSNEVLGNELCISNNEAGIVNADEVINKDDVDVNLHENFGSTINLDSDIIDLLSNNNIGMDIPEIKSLDFVNNDSYDDNIVPDNTNNNIFQFMKDIVHDPNKLSLEVLSKLALPDIFKLIIELSNMCRISVQEHNSNIQKKDVDTQCTLLMGNNMAINIDKDNRNDTSKEYKIDKTVQCSQYSDINSADKVSFDTKETICGDFNANQFLIENVRNFDNEYTSGNKVIEDSINDIYKRSAGKDDLNKNVGKGNAMYNNDCNNNCNCYLNSLKTNNTNSEASLDNNINDIGNIHNGKQHYIESYNYIETKIYRRSTNYDKMNIKNDYGQDRVNIGKDNNKSRKIDNNGNVFYYNTKNRYKSFTEANKTTKPLLSCSHITSSYCNNNLCDKYMSNNSYVRYNKYFVSNLSGGITVRDIKKLLGDKIRTKVTCYKINMFNSNSSSFFISIPEQKHLEFISSCLWPRGTFISFFYGSLASSLKIY